jgi:hypothetical protein
VNELAGGLVALVTVGSVLAGEFLIIMAGEAFLAMLELALAVV